MTPEDLKEWRAVMGLKTQQDAAELLGYNRPYYAEFESGKRPIPENVALVCAAHFHRIKPWPECR